MSGGGKGRNTFQSLMGTVSYSKEPFPSESFIPSIPVRHSKVTALESSWSDTSDFLFLVLSEPQADKVFANQNNLLALSLQLPHPIRRCWAWRRDGCEKNAFYESVCRSEKLFCTFLGAQRGLQLGLGFMGQHVF